MRIDAWVVRVRAGRPRYNATMSDDDDRSRAVRGSGKWLAAGIVVLGVVLALLALKFRQDPDKTPTTVPSTLPIAQDPRDQPVQR
jgi:hypothetical protein